MKIERGFAKCPVTGCAARKVLFVAVQRDTFGLMNVAMTGVVPAGWRNYPGQLEAFREHGAYCETHATGMVISRIKAFRNPDVACTAKCRGALGPNCECECAGKNHGKSAMASLG